MSRDKPLAVLGLGGSGLEGSGSEQLLVARIGTSVEVKGFIKGEAGAAGSDRQDVCSLL